MHPADLAEVGPAGRLRGRAGGHGLAVRDNSGPARRVPGLFCQVGSDTSSASRTGAFSSAIPFIQQHPWLGRGFGTFLPATYFFTDDQYLLPSSKPASSASLALLGLFITGWLTAERPPHV